MCASDAMHTNTNTNTKANTITNTNWISQEVGGRAILDTCASNAKHTNTNTNTKANTNTNTNWTSQEVGGRAILDTCDAMQCIQLPGLLSRFPDWPRSSMGLGWERIAGVFGSVKKNEGCGKYI